MKKTLITILLVFLGFSVSAQDTLTRPPSYCMLHYWPENTSEIDTIYFAYPIEHARWHYDRPSINIVTATTLEKQCMIYGVSVALISVPYMKHQYGISPHPNQIVLDTSIEKEREKIRHYCRNGDSLYVEHEVEWRYNEHPVDWYLWTGYENFIPGTAYFNPPYCELWPLPNMVPMYDMYFDEPFSYTPGDTLYLGVDTHTWRCAGPADPWVYDLITYPVRPVRVFFRGNIVVYTGIGGGLCESPDTNGYHGYSLPSFQYNSRICRNLAIYPIIAPPPPPPAPQISIQPIEEVKVSLYPNPANDMVKITSSISMTNISATSIDGRTIYNKPHAGKTTTMDIHSWPAGLYFITIATPAGNKVQKLLKR
ncbi:MAG: T9SS type A sorting domain-containing protein [Bacteroidales bacterium]|nr:T9SS type A sorting domain-containing protein [Bacteroidales bacterium]